MEILVHTVGLGRDRVPKLSKSSGSPVSVLDFGLRFAFYLIVESR